MLSNFDPATKTHGHGQGRSIDDRALVDPDRNNFGAAPRLRLLARRRRPSSAAATGISYIHFHRAGGGNLLPINGPQVITAVVDRSRTRRRRRSGRRSRATRPASPIRRASTRCSPTSPTCRATTRRARSRAGSCRCSASWRRTWWSTSPTSGNHADEPAAVRELQPGAAEQRRGHRCRSQARRPIPEFGDITYAFNGGFSRYNSLQVRFEYRHGAAA